MREINLPIRTDGVEAALRLFLWENSLEYHQGRLRPVMIVCTGGAYKMLSDQENQPIVARFLAMGYHVASLHYALAPQHHWPVQLHELAESVAILRANSAQWCIDPEKIVVSGYSAGGHLAASLGVLWNAPWLSSDLGRTPEEIRPNAMLLAYPVLTAVNPYHRGSFRNLLGDGWEERLDEVSLEKHVTPDTPPAFLWHTGEDTAVPIEGTLAFALALRENGVPFDLHIYQKGRHSLSLATPLTDIGKPGYQNVCVAQWPEQARLWLMQLFAE